MHTDTHSLTHTLIQLHTDSRWHTFIYAVNQQKAASSAALALQASATFLSSTWRFSHSHAGSQIYVHFILFLLAFVCRMHISLSFSFSFTLEHFITLHLLLLLNFSTALPSPHCPNNVAVSPVLLYLSYCPFLQHWNCRVSQQQHPKITARNPTAQVTCGCAWLGLGIGDGEAATPFKCFMISGWDERNANVDAVKRFTVPCFYIPLPPLLPLSTSLRMEYKYWGANRRGKKENQFNSIAGNGSSRKSELCHFH